MVLKSRHFLWSLWNAAKMILKQHPSPQEVWQYFWKNRRLWFFKRCTLQMWDQDGIEIYLLTSCNHSEQLSKDLGGLLFAIGPFISQSACWSLWVCFVAFCFSPVFRLYTAMFLGSHRSYRGVIWVWSFSLGDGWGSHPGLRGMEVFKLRKCSSLANTLEQWKATWLFAVYRGLYYPIIWGL